MRILSRIDECLVGEKFISPLDKLTSCITLLIGEGAFPVGDISCAFNIPLAAQASMMLLEVSTLDFVLENIRGKPLSRLDRLSG